MRTPASLRKDCGEDPLIVWGPCVGTVTQRQHQPWELPAQGGAPGSLEVLPERPLGAATPPMSTGGRAYAIYGIAVPNAAGIGRSGTQ